MNILWEKILEDGTQICKLKNGSFIFLKESFIKGSYYAIAKIEMVTTPKSLGKNQVDFEILGFDAFDRLSLKASILENMGIESIINFMKQRYNINLSPDIIDDIESMRLARRLLDGQ